MDSTQKVAWNPRTNIFNVSFGGTFVLLRFVQPVNTASCFGFRKCRRNPLIVSEFLDVGYCSDFRYESDGIFVLGVGFFFFRQISTFYLAIFDRIFFISFKRYCCPKLKFEKIFHL